MPKMRSKQLNLDSYNTDKVTYGYLDVYDPILLPWVGNEVKLLEIGIYQGGSLELWRDYFPLGTIIGIDVKLPKHFVPGERIQTFEGNQSDEQFLSEVANRAAPDGFDIIIDDASHIGEVTKKRFGVCSIITSSRVGYMRLRTGARATGMISPTVKDSI